MVKSASKEVENRRGTASSYWQSEEGHQRKVVQASSEDADTARGGDSDVGPVFDVFYVRS